jgi:hypothetical protein
LPNRVTREPLAVIEDGVCYYHEAAAVAGVPDDLPAAICEYCGECITDDEPECPARADGRCQA